MSEAIKIRNILSEKVSSIPNPEDVVLKEATFVADENNLEISEHSSYPAVELEQDAGEKMPLNSNPMSSPYDENEMMEHELELRVWDLVSEEEWQNVRVRPNFWLRFLGYNPLIAIIGLGLGAFVAALILDGKFDDIYHVVMNIRNKLF